MGTTYYHWDDVDDCVMHETDNLGATIVTYTREPGRFGPLISETRGGTTFAHHYDALGSTTMLTNDSGTVTDTFQFDAWGNATARTGTTVSRYQWCGRLGYQCESEYLSHHVRTRVYTPTIARWNSFDPAEFPDSLDRFLAFTNAPTLFVDPTGLLIRWKTDLITDTIWELRYWAPGPTASLIDSIVS